MLVENKLDAVKHHQLLINKYHQLTLDHREANRRVIRSHIRVHNG